MESKTTYIIARLLILNSILLLTTACHNNAKPIVPILHDTVYKYLPHRAPDSAYLGRYEEVKGPFMMAKSPGSRDSVLIEDHQWRIDSGCHNYITTASGYLHQRGKDGRITDIPMTIEDSNRYDSLRTWLPASRHLPIAAALSSKKLPAAVHLPGKKEEDVVKALWRKLRHVKLPYTYKANSNMELTITNRKVSTETIHDTIYLKTKLTCSARFMDDKLPAQPLTMEETEPVE